MATEESRVDQYFQRKVFKNGPTRADCDSLAEKLVGGPVTPVLEQGLCSYTVLAGDKQDRIVQFREETVDQVKAELTDQAWKIHGDIVPRCTIIGEIGILKICVMPKISGKSHSEVCYKHPGPLPALARASLETTTNDLGRFFAESWTAAQRGRQDEPFAIAQREFITTEMGNFTNSLPARFKPFLEKVRSHMHLMFEPDYRYVLTHLDLLPWNILVDDAGHITGVIDWWDAQLIPFGVAVQGMFFMLLGWMNKEKLEWQYYAEHEEVEALFWRTFDDVSGGMSGKERVAMEVTQMVGYFLRYGSTWDESIGAHGGYRPSREGDEKLAYLDAVVRWTTSKKDSFWETE